MQINYLISQIPFLIVPDLQNLITVLYTTTYLLEQKIWVHPYETGNNLKRFCGPAHGNSSLGPGHTRGGIGSIICPLLSQKDHSQF